jgi:hypothetical protein
MATWVLKWREPDDLPYYGGRVCSWTAKSGAYRYRSRREAFAEQKRLSGGADVIQVLRRGPRMAYRLPNGMQLVPCLIAVEAVARAVVRLAEDGAAVRATNLLLGDLAHWLAKVDEQRAAL